LQQREIIALAGKPEGSSEAPVTLRPRVSIAIPAYDEEEEICGAMNEAFNQTYLDREIVVVDDGSTDKTLENARRCARGKEDTRVVSTLHGGLTHARNVALSQCKGEIVVFLECDCVYDGDYVEKAVNALDENPNASAVCLTGAPLKLRSTLATECIEIENVVQHELLRQGKLQPFYAWVFRKQSLESIGGFDEKLFQGEDKDMFRRYTAAGNKVVWVPGVHWKHKRSQTLSRMAVKWVGRGQSRILFVLKHRLFRDLAKTILPFWILVCGAIFLFVSWPIGVAMIGLVFSLILYRSLRVTMISWAIVSRRRTYFEYPLFLATRNFCSGIGYSIGLLSVAGTKLRLRKNDTGR
jgi:glycosyltransferase involved in cell wall biosynthesis